MSSADSSASVLIFRFRIVMGFFITALVASGVTAFPLRWELSLLAGWFGIEPGTDPASLTGLRYWIAYVHEGLETSYGRYPFLAYGTDWLAFAHLMIAVFFIGPFREPARHEWTLISGLVACISIVPLAMICGQIRGIPFYWRLIDCSFGIIGAIPLFYCLKTSRKLRRMAGDFR